MSTQLVLLVGTNPLPVWVAWECLKDRLPQIERVLLVYTKETEPEFNRLAKLIENDRMFLESCRTEPGDPGYIQRAIGQLVASMPKEITDIHVHYTGGTKVMAVAAVEIVRDFCRNTHRDFDASYLDPRAGEGPRIIDGRGREIELDPRKKIDANLQQIAELNGFQIAPFWQQYKGIKRWMPEPYVLSNLERQAGRIWLNAMRERQVREEIRTDWPKTGFTAEKEDFKYPDEGLRVRLLPNSEEGLRRKLLSSLMEICKNGIIEPESGWVRFKAKSEASEPEKNDLKALNKFLTGGWLEFAAYDALRASLEEIEKRKNFAVFSAVYVMRAGNDPTARCFELDVVALLGYQLLVISCGASIFEDEIKKKGMEALMRARQLGGDEARAIVLCPLWPNSARLVEEGLYDEMGSAAWPLQVWGENCWRDLTGRFSTYLRKLAWI